MNDIQISKNFNLKEFECKSTGQVKIHERLLELLQELRNDLEKPILINSGYRSEERNQKVGGADGSQHLEGTAVDISLRNLNLNAKDLSLRVQLIADDLGIGRNNLGLGYANTFLHIDVRGLIGASSPAQWNYN